MSSGSHEVIPLTDLWVGLIKAPVFGFIIALAGCFQGMLVQGIANKSVREPPPPLCSRFFW